MERKRSTIRLQKDCGTESLTNQADKDLVNINSIMARAYKTGVMPQTTAQALYSDLSDPVDYAEAMAIQLHAQEQFDALPVQTRNRFNNQPSEFLTFAAEEKNKKEILELVTGVKIRQTQEERSEENRKQKLKDLEPKT